MYICVCNAVTDSDIRAAVEDGVHNLKQLRFATGCTSTCGCCKQVAVDVLKQALAEKRTASSLLPILQMA